MTKEKILKGLKWFLKSYLWLIPLIIIFDYVTKVIAFDKNVNLTIINNFFYFKLYGNTGAAWSILEEHPEILAIISVLATAAMTFIIIKYYKKFKKLTLISIYLMLAGTVGNMIDRCLQFVPGTRYYGFGVIDFISFQFASYHFPVFNIADSSLVIGVILLMVVTIVDEVLIYVYKKKIDELQPKYIEVINSADEDTKKQYNSILELISTNIAENNLSDLKKNYKTLEELVNSFKKDEKDEN
ncbi:MAG: signal peptidase II [Bacilli bacterium]